MAVPVFGPQQSKESKMLFYRSAVILALVMAPPASGAVANCERFLTGNWAGKGVVTGFGQPVQVDNAYSYHKNGTFITINRYLGQDKRWVEQKLTGTWNARSGRSRSQCVLVLKSAGPLLTSSSTSEVRIIDKDTFRSLDFDMRRVRK